MPDLLVIAVAGLGTYALRAMFLLRRSVPARDRRSTVLELVAPAVLAALTLPVLLVPQGVFSLRETVASMAAAAACAAVWHRTRGFPVPLLTGLVVWSVAAALLGCS